MEDSAAKAKRYLERLETLDDIIIQKKQEYLDLNASITSISSADPSREHIQGSPDDPAFAKKVIRLLELKHEIEQDIVSFEELKHQVIGEIRAIQDRKYMILLYKRYVEYKPMVRIAEEMGYTYDYIRKLHAKALKIFQKRHTKAH